jgi:hypothetical protein
MAGELEAVAMRFCGGGAALAAGGANGRDCTGDKGAPGKLPELFAAGGMLEVKSALLAVD